MIKIVETPTEKGSRSVGRRLYTTMSDPEGTSASPDGDEEQDAGELEVPIRALAPEADLEEQRPSQISANPALQCLEEVTALFCHHISRMS
ncbi:hypothetical protein SRHO_G00089200 [Serrasalmus rhombeus]